MAARTLSRVLVVEDSDALRTTLERVLATRYEEVRSAACVAEARELLAVFRPDLLLMDVDLPDGSALDVMRFALEQGSVPVAIAMSGAASPSQSFELAQLGVRTYLPKPVDLDQLERAIESAAASSPDVAPLVRASVGQRPIHEVEEEVRKTMLEEALSRTGGSRRGAARLLQVSRQLIQHMLRRNDVD